VSWDETEYRQEVQKTLERIEKAFSEVDPDLAECEQSMEAMTITFSDRSRLILSMQPSVRQLWLALASKGTAYHFDFERTGRKWMDDKGRGVELIGFLGSYFLEIGVDLKL
jgi:CyaY protein